MADMFLMAVTTLVMMGGVVVQGLATVAALPVASVFLALPPGPTTTTGFVREQKIIVGGEAIGRGQLGLAVRLIPVVLVRLVFWLGFVKARVVGLGGIYKTCCNNGVPEACRGGEHTGTCPHQEVHCGYDGHRPCGAAACCGSPKCLEGGVCYDPTCPSGDHPSDCGQQTRLTRTGLSKALPNLRFVRPVYPKPRKRGMGSEGKDTGES